MNIVQFIKTPKSYFRKLSKNFHSFTRRYYYKGDTVSCEICTWKGSKFYNEKCPKCKSLPRTRLVPFAINHFGLNKSGLEILHIAPNVNEYEYVMSSFENLELYDRLDIKKRKQINKVRDLKNSQFDSSSYDLIIIWHVLEHIKDDSAAIKEMYRLLKPGGNLLMSVPIYPDFNKLTFEDSNIKYEDYESRHGHYDHCRSCGYDYYERFEHHGFKTAVLDIRNVENVDVETYGLLKEHVSWCFTK